MAWKNKLSDLLNIRYPLIQAPMLGATSPEMVAAVSKEGGLGSLPVGGLSPEATLQLIQKTKSLTGQPFAVNLFVHDVPAYNDEDLEPMRHLLLEMSAGKGYRLRRSDLEGFQFYTYHSQLDVLLQERIRIVSFTFGCLDASSIRLLKDRGCILIGTATCLQEALLLQEQQIDMVCLQGIEAGGHRGTFIDGPLPQVGLFSLLTQAMEQVTIPCIAAGGINSGQAMKAAFDLGADAVQVGTLFIGTDESEAISSYKSKLEAAKDTDTALTRAFSGRWARGMRNEMMDCIEASGIVIPPYPLQNSLTAKLRKMAQQVNDAGFTNLWAGQSGGKGSSKKSKDVFLDLVRQYEMLG